jgi:hypothetical protein
MPGWRKTYKPLSWRKNRFCQRLSWAFLVGGQTTKIPPFTQMPKSFALSKQLPLRLNSVQF